jgi:hypothetical protein
MRRDSFLNQLTAQQQDTLYDWLQGDSYPTVQKRVATPAPEGFGIHVHITSLKRFFRKRTEELRAAAAEELRMEAKSETPPSFSEAAADSIQYMAYDIATSGGPAANFNDLSRWLVRNKTLQLKEAYLRVAQEHLALAKEQLALEKKKFEFNAARLALEHAHDLNQIAHQPNLDDEDKIRRAREKLFGPNLPD